MRTIVFILLLSLSGGLFSQNNIDSLGLVVPSEGKCIVYITRRATSAMLIKFKIYDGDIFLGKIGHGKYFAYECDPGEHVFIAKGENTSYLDANLEAGKIYIMDTQVKMGVMTARVGLEPFIDKTHKKYEKERKKFLEFIVKKKGEILVDSEDDDPDDGSEESTPSKMVEKFKKMKAEGKKLKTISPEMYFE